MYKILKTVDKGVVELTITSKNLEYFRAELQPVFIATDIDTFSQASDLVDWFNRPIVDLFDKLMPAPHNYTDPTIAVGSDDFNF